MGQLPLIIVNPASARGATRNVWAGMASDLATHFGAFSCAFTERRGDSKRIASRAALNGTDFIIACGGDGTISEVANGILESGVDVVLGVLPSGTGGDFRRSLEMPSRTADVAHTLRTGRTMRMDVGRVAFKNNSGVEETRYFLGIASFGMSGEVIERVKEQKSPWTAALPGSSLGGKVVFGKAMLKTAINAAHKSVVVRLDNGASRTISVTNFCVANSRYFGGGMKIAPDALMNDGYFDVIEIGELGTAGILANSPRLYSGAHLNMKEVRHELARSVEARGIDGDPAIRIEIDGELPGTLPAKFEIIHLALRVRCGPGGR